MNIKIINDSLIDTRMKKKMNTENSLSGLM